MNLADPTVDTGMWIPIDDVIVGDRIREDLGDLGDLMASIEDVGLLQPIGVDVEQRLVFGARRLEAKRMLGHTSIACRLVENLADAEQALRAERDENTCRKDFTPTEMVRFGRMLEGIERQAAAERMLAGTQPSGNFPEGTGDTRDKVGDALGVSGRTYEKAKSVVDAAEAGDPVALEAQAEMDATGKVHPAYERVQDAKRISSGQFQELHALVVSVPQSYQRKLKDAFKRAMGAHIEKLPVEKFDDALAWLTAETDAILADLEAGALEEEEGAGSGPVSLPAPSSEDVSTSPVEMIDSTGEEQVAAPTPPAAPDASDVPRRSGRVNPEPKSNATPYRARAVPVVQVMGAALAEVHKFAAHPEGLVHGFDRALAAATPTERDEWIATVDELASILAEMQAVIIR